MQHSTRRWPAWLAMLTLIAGLGVGAIGLASAAGIWLGVWDFRTGFTLLAIADGHASWIAGVGLVATIVVVVFSRGAAESRALKLGALALIGTLAAAVAYYVPESYRPAPETPPIHDVSTDTTDPPHYVAILPLRADSPNTTVYGGSPNMTPERLADLQTRALGQILLPIVQPGPTRPDVAQRPPGDTLPFEPSQSPRAAPGSMMLFFALMISDYANALQKIMLSIFFLSLCVLFLI